MPKCGCEVLGTHGELVLGQMMDGKCDRWRCGLPRNGPQIKMGSRDPWPAWISFICVGSRESSSACIACDTRGQCRFKDAVMRRCAARLPAVPSSRTWLSLALGSSRGLQSPAACFYYFYFAVAVPALPRCASVTWDEHFGVAAARLPGDALSTVPSLATAVDGRDSHAHARLLSDSRSPTSLCSRNSKQSLSGAWTLHNRRVTHAQSSAVRARRASRYVFCSLRLSSANQRSPLLTRKPAMASVNDPVVRNLFSSADGF